MFNSYFSKPGLDSLYLSDYAIGNVFSNDPNFVSFTSPMQNYMMFNGPLSVNNGNYMGGSYDFMNNSIYSGATQQCSTAQSDYVHSSVNSHTISFFAPKNASALSSMKSQLESDLKSDELNDSQIERLEILLEKVEALIVKYEALATKAESGTDLAGTATSMKALYFEITALQKSGQELRKTIQKEIIDAASEAEDDDEVEDDGAGGGSTPVKRTPESKRNNEINEDVDADGRSTELRELGKHEVGDIVSGIRLATEGLFTNNGNLDKLMNKNGDSKSSECINVDNIIEVFDAWDSNYNEKADNVDSEDSLIAYVSDDVSNARQRKYYVYILDTLQERARMYDLDVSKEVTSTKKEVNKWLCTYDSKVNKAIMQIVGKIKAQEATNKTQFASDKTEYETKQKERNEELKKEFLANLADATGNEAKDLTTFPANVTVETDDNSKFKKFVVKVGSKEYEGTSLKVIKSKMKTAGMSTKQIDQALTNLAETAKKKGVTP